MSPQETSTTGSRSTRLTSQGPLVFFNNPSQDIILDVEHLEEPQDILAYLKNKYEPSGLAHQFAIYQEWQSVNYDRKGLEDFTQEYSQACAGLKESKLDVSNTIKVYQFVTLISP